MCPVRQDGRADPEHHRVLHELLPGPHHDCAAHGEPGREFQQRPSGYHDPGHSGAPGPCGQQEPLLWQHHHEKELCRRSADHRWRKRPDRSSRPPHQGAAGGRGGRLQSQRRQRGRPGHAGRTASNDLLGLQDGAGVYPHRQKQQPHFGRVQRIHPRGMDGALPELRFLSALCLGQHGVRQGKVAGRRRAIPLRRVWLP